ncbi:MAG: hypothetical protein ACLFT2_02800, partial [Candidatus Brocadiia bacterium]
MAPKRYQWSVSEDIQKQLPVFVKYSDDSSAREEIWIILGTRILTDTSIRGRFVVILLGDLAIVFGL